MHESRPEVINNFVISRIRPCDLPRPSATFFAEVAHHNSPTNNEINMSARPTRPFLSLTRARMCACVRMRENYEKGRVGRGNADKPRTVQDFRRATFSFKVARGRVGRERTEI